MEKVSEGVGKANYHRSINMNAHLPTEPDRKSDDNDEPGCIAPACGCCLSGCVCGCIVTVVENIGWLILIAVILYAIGWYVLEGMN